MLVRQIAWFVCVCSAAHGVMMKVHQIAQASRMAASSKKIPGQRGRDGMGGWLRQPSLPSCVASSGGCARATSGVRSDVGA